MIAYAAVNAPRLIGIIGILVVILGLRLLWQARGGFFYWLETYLRLFAKQLREPEAKAQPQPLGLAGRAPGERHTLRLAIGMALVFLLGPVLIALGLTL